MLHNMSYITSFVTMATYWVPDLPDIKSFAGRLWRSILIFPTMPHKDKDMFGRVGGLLNVF